jgi:DNA-binding winged helix-turn-helix (wHTH) protein
MNQIEPLDGPSLPKLTKKEQELLELLQGNPGRCFSRAYLLQRIWGYRDDTRTRTVDVHVSRLRKKLEDRTDLAIHTVVRQGYVLELRGGAKRPGETSYGSGDEAGSPSAPHVWAN